MLLPYKVLDLVCEAIPSLFAILTFLCLVAVSRIFGARNGQEVKDEAPTLPYKYPILRNTMEFAFRGPELFNKLLTSFPTIAGALRIRLINEDIYIVHGPKNVTAVSQNTNLSVTKAYGYALRHCFGMKKAAAALYHRDTSGSRTKPIAGSNVSASSRIGIHTHANIAEGLLVTGLEPMTQRFEAALAAALHDHKIDTEWKQYSDLATFFEDVLGRAVLDAVFGPALLETNKSFVRDLFEYDKVVMDLARRVPWFIKPLPYRLRSGIVKMVKKWHTAVTSTSPSDQSNNSHSGWGSSMLKSRYEMLMRSDTQDADSVASTDFAFIWASVTNVVPSTLIMAVQAICDPCLLQELRAAMDERCFDQTTTISHEELTKIPILASLYAETLRFGVQIHIPRDAPHHTVQIGKSILPKNSFIMMNTWLAHSDAEAWNTQSGRRPLDQFWPHRFLVYADDPCSGPCKNTAWREGLDFDNKKAVFSTDGLQGAWIPYGSGHHACPGRLLAKRIMLHTVALLVRLYDVEILPGNKIPEFASPRFGFGVKKLAHHAPFRIRQRSVRSL
ncbi:cytochrome P450 [Plenodomus tracheiphilus IPT5]|uniref:Cytochrome P450 n=1 Tax=Plenodomus tracheiphilus IPT5 TaxID=1408161 RepID=A0A6A7AW85_9PLEO|nr:cytochrome P450 [Plenodomus tracheiphilus IPT5]